MRRPPIARVAVSLTAALVSLVPLSVPAKPLRVVVQADEHLRNARELLKAAFDAAGTEVQFEMAPLANEKRQLLLLEQGQTHIDLMPVTPERLRSVKEGKSRMIPIPLDRGLLGFRLCLLLKSREHLLANVRSVSDLRQFTFGQGEGWMDVDIYERAGIPTKWIRDWRNGEFVQQMEAGFFDIFPLGAEETLHFFLPHYQSLYPQITADPHLVLAYPWFRFVWISVAAENADAIQESLARGFHIIAKNGEFLRIWNQRRKGLPESFFDGRRIIRLENPFYGYELIPPEFQKLLLTKEP